MATTMLPNSKTTGSKGLHSQPSLGHEWLVGVGVAAAITVAMWAMGFLLVILL